MNRNETRSKRSYGPYVPQSFRIFSSIRPPRKLAPWHGFAPGLQIPCCARTAIGANLCAHPSGALQRLGRLWPLRSSLAVGALTLLAACGGGGGGDGAATIPPPTVTGALSYVPGQFLASSTFANRCAAPRSGTDPISQQKY